MTCRYQQVLAVPSWTKPRHFSVAILRMTPNQGVHDRAFFIWGGMPLRSQRPRSCRLLWKHSMLILTRKRGQRITIGDVVITVTHTGPTSAKIGIEAPDHIPITRDDVNKTRSSSN